MDVGNLHPIWPFGKVRPAQIFRFIQIKRPIYTFRKKKLRIVMSGTTRFTAYIGEYTSLRN